MKYTKDIRDWILKNPKGYELIVLAITLAVKAGKNTDDFTSNDWREYLDKAIKLKQRESTS